MKFCAKQINYFQKLTWCFELCWVILEQPLPGEVSDGSEDDDRSRESRVAEGDALIGGELALALAPHQVLPVVLKYEKKQNVVSMIIKMFTYALLHAMSKQTTVKGTQDIP